MTLLLHLLVEREDPSINTVTELVVVIAVLIQILIKYGCVVTILTNGV